MNTVSHHPIDDGTKPAAIATPQAIQWLALGAVAGPVLFALTWIVLGLLRPGYSPLRQQISDLALGPTVSSWASLLCSADSLP